jgi:MFS family permease
VTRIPGASSSGTTPTLGKSGVDFWKFLLGQTISNVGSSFTLFVLPVLVYDLTGSALNLALIYAAEYIPYMLFGLVIGAWVDRLDRKRLMIYVEVAQSLVILSVPLLVALDLLSIWWIYGVGFVSSTLIAFSFTAVGRAERYLPKEKLQKP